MGELTPQQRHRIYLEEEARLQARQYLNDKKKGGCAMMAGYLLLAVAVMIVVGMTLSSRNVGNVSTQASDNPTGNPAVDGMIASSDAVQTKVLEASVNHAYAENDACNATRIFYMGQGPDNQGWWSIACSNGHSYEVQIDPNATGSSGVLDCDVLRAFHTDVCFHSVEEMKRMK
jgi:hypothetical protein